MDKKDRLNYYKREMFNFYKLRNCLKLKRRVFLFFPLVLLLWWPLVSAGFVFEKIVTEGEEDPSIKNLQIILNQDSRTQVAKVGAGAPGAETSFFGARTRGALARFQRLNGISGEYGFVGRKTRLALNKKLAESYFAETAASEDKLTDQLAKTQKTFVFRLPSDIRGNVTRLADKKSPYIKRLEETEKSESKKSQVVAGKPKITSLSPARGAYGVMVKIKGENFTATGNTIYTGYSVLKNVSSPDKETLTFTVQAFGAEYQQSRSLTNHFESFSIPLLVYVENANGQSNSLTFNYQF
ncbi:MAG TPA: IPT/TIG domain-containing protein [Candidatus Paceibacterota bacterium]|nr:IPT/TIG domain-containing protein [Candidatus Paceibacterota bacterium]